MAIFGGLGKSLGLGSTQQVASGITQIGQSLSGASGLFSGISSIFGGGTQQGQGTAVDQPKQTIPQETAASSQVEAGLLPGGLLSTGIQALRPLVGTGIQTLRSPIGQIGLGVAGGLLADASMGNGGQVVRVTRKQQQQVKQMVELLGIEAAANVLGISVADVAMILTKKFRARGKGITAAQLRTATRVNNRIIHMHDKLKAAYGSATRRTTTSRARAGTRVTQIKN